MSTKDAGGKRLRRQAKDDDAAKLATPEHVAKLLMENEHLIALAYAAAQSYDAERLDGAQRQLQRNLRTLERWREEDAAAVAAEQALAEK